MRDLELDEDNFFNKEEDLLGVKKKKQTTSAAGESNEAELVVLDKNF